jgi:hypothetical protein
LPSTTASTSSFGPGAPQPRGDRIHAVEPDQPSPLGPHRPYGRRAGMRRPLEFRWRRNLPGEAGPRGRSRWTDESVVPRASNPP